MDFGKLVGDFAGGVGSVLALPFNGFNTQNVLQKAGYQPPAPTYQPPKPQAQPAAPSTDYGDLQSQLAASAERLKALQYQVAQTPKIYNYDIAGAYSRARSAAEGAVNPFYAKKLNDFVAGQEVKKQRANQDAGLMNRDIEQALQDALDTSNLNRGRTTEDVDTKLGNIQNEENYFQDSEGTQFDRARQALLAQGAESGMLGSGLGAQQDANAISDRNAKSAQQVESFNTQKRATELFKTRTFEDLQRGDTLAQRDTGQKKEKVQIDLDRQLEDVTRETENFKYQTEAERLGAILEEQNRQAKLDFTNFVSGLTGRGARSQDIAATANLYGNFF